jgi:diguanylate cyclase (GGDEF)-like protein/PAS domain S-box-containing protein
MTKPHPAPDSIETRPSDKPWKILVVDDEENIRLVLAEFMRLDGHLVETASCGSEALASIRETEYDIVVSDIILPDVNGLEMMGEIRRLLPSAIFILITGMPTVETATTALRTGVHDYLCKPITHSAISRAVSNAIRIKTLSDRNAALEGENERYRDWLEEMVKHKTEKLQHSMRQLTNLRSALDRTRILVVTDTNNRIRYSNAKFSQLVGIARNKLIGRDWFGIVTDVHDDLLIMEIQETIATGKIWQGTVSGRSRDGRRWWTETAIVPFLGPEDQHLQNIIIQADTSAIIESRERIRTLAYTDNMTGLPNRTRFCELIMSEAENGTDYGGFAICMLDLDGFKSFNEAYGRDIGDAILIEFVDRVQASIGKHILARLGSDQFGILLRTPTSEKDALSFAGKLQSLFIKPFIINNHEYHITACNGIALFPRHGRNSETLLQNASLALDLAKGEGHCHFGVYRSRMHQLALSRISLENELRQALVNEEFELFYQPKIELSTGRLVGAEALLRWRKPGVGIVPPAEFIPYAEESGLIIKIGRWVLEEACRQLAAWKLQGFPEIIVSVNVSARQFRHPNIITYVVAALTSCGVDPDFLELEITENVLMNGVGNTLDTLNELHDIGVRLSIDDFGTGFSSLAYLKDFPIQVLKIDRSFISNIGRDERDSSIARGIINLAQNLNLRVLAEGVETKDQLEFLRLEGCDEIQGYWFSPPIPAFDFYTKYANLVS